MSGDDVIIGKTTPISQGQVLRYTRRDHSISLRHSETGIVDRVSISIYFTLMCCMFSLSLYIYVMNA